MGLDFNDKTLENVDFPIGMELKYTQILGNQNTFFTVKCFFYYNSRGNPCTPHVLTPSGLRPRLPATIYNQKLPN